MSNKIISAGMICLDIAPVFPEGGPKTTGEVFVPGKMINLNGADIHTGGSVANTGLALKIFGADVSLMGKVGKDPFGGLILDIIQKRGAADGMIVSDDATSFTIVLSPPGIDRMFLQFPGCNDSFCFEDIDFDKIRGAALFHFGYPTIMRNMYTDGGAELLRIFREVKSMGVLTSLDLTTVDPASAAAGEDWRKILEKVMPYVDFFVPSAEELCFSLDKKRHAEWQCRAGGSDIARILDLDRDIRPLASELMDMGAKIALIKCGAPGLYLKTAESELPARFTAWAGTDRFEESYKEDSFAAATGAGDTSIAAFLKAALDGKTPERCMQLAVAAGACCVTAFDALSGLIPFEDMEARIDAGWEKLRVDR